MNTKMNKDEELLAMMAAMIFASCEGRVYTTARTSIFSAIDILNNIKNPQDHVAKAAKFAGLNIGVNSDQVSTSGLKKKYRKTPRMSPKSSSMKNLRIRKTEKL